MNLQKAKITKTTYIPLFNSAVQAGFPSPADDFIERQLDLNEFLIDHPEATFFVRVSGNSMINAGIRTGDILIVDKSIQAVDQSIVVAIIDGEFTVKRLKRTGDKIWLLPENKYFQPIEVKEGMNFEIWGVVTYVIHTAS